MKVGPVNYSFTCSGVVVGPNQVLTAAHCIRGLQPNQVAVQVGQSTAIAVQSIALFPTSPGSRPDLAVLVLANAVPSSVAQIPVDTSSTPAPGQFVYVQGYGPGGFQWTQAQMLVQYLDYTGVDPDGLPAGPRFQMGPLVPFSFQFTPGDSGGPVLACDPVCRLIGIVSTNLGGAGRPDIIYASMLSGQNAAWVQDAVQAVTVTFGVHNNYSSPTVQASLTSGNSGLFECDVTATQTVNAGVAWNTCALPNTGSVTAHFYGQDQSGQQNTNTARMTYPYPGPIDTQFCFKVQTLDTSAADQSLWVQRQGCPSPTPIGDPWTPTFTVHGDDGLTTRSTDHLADICYRSAGGCRTVHAGDDPVAQFRGQRDHLPGE